MKTTNLVHESLDQLFEEKNKKVELVKKLKTQGGTTVKHSKTSKADEAIAGLRKQLEKAKKPGAYRTTVEKRAAIADLEKKIKSWEDKKKVNESFGNDEIFSFTWDTCVDVKKENNTWVIDRNGDDEAYIFDDLLKENGIEYEIVNPDGPGGGWPEIQYTGTKAQLAKVMVLLNASGYEEDEILDMLKDWDGNDHEVLLNILG